MSARLGVSKFAAGPCMSLDDIQQQLVRLDYTLGNPAPPVSTTTIEYNNVWHYEDGTGDDVLVYYDNNLQQVIEILNLTDNSPVVTVFQATVNDATHVINTDGTLEFDGTTGIIGTNPASGTANNTFGQSFNDNELILVFGNATPTYYAMKVQPVIARAFVNQSGGVPHDDAEFDIDSISAILGTAPATGVASNTAGIAFADNQEILVIQQANGKWFPMHLRNSALAKVTTGITARSGTDPYTWGSGVVTILKKTGTATHASSGGTASITVYNSTTGTAAVDDIIQLKRVDGELFWDVGDC